VFNFDTPWHPDDYVHRIGRTGRAGAKGRAFTFVCEEDAEAIANVEKLTGSAIKVFGKADVRVDLSEVMARAEAAKVAQPEPDASEERPESKPRRAKGHKHEERREAKPRRDQDEPRRERAERKPRRYEADDEPGPPGEWNGPRPAFLDVGFG
jgi:superfamily II DNA/RNA helicase